MIPAESKPESGEVPAAAQVRQYIKSTREEISLITVTNCTVLWAMNLVLELKL